MTTNHNHYPRPDDDNRPPADPLRPDRLRCDCGATADRHGLCRKCCSRCGRDATPAAAPTPTGRPPAAASPGPPAATPGTSDDQHPYQEGDLAVIVSVSLVLLLGLLIVFLVRYTKLRTWHAILCILFGFYVASTRWAPTSTPRPPP